MNEFTTMTAKDTLLAALSIALIGVAVATVGYGFYVLGAAFKGLPPGPLNSNSMNSVFLEQKTKIVVWFVLFGIGAVLGLALIILNPR